jgi:hypothetical protein
VGDMCNRGGGGSPDGVVMPLPTETTHRDAPQQAALIHHVPWTVTDPANQRKVSRHLQPR